MLRVLRRVFWVYISTPLTVSHAWLNDTCVALQSLFMLFCLNLQINSVCIQQALLLLATYGIQYLIMIQKCGHKLSACLHMPIADENCFCCCAWSTSHIFWEFTLPSYPIVRSHAGPCSLVVCYMAACVTYYETVKTDYRLLQQVTTPLALPQNVSLSYCVALATLFG